MPGEAEQFNLTREDYLNLQSGRNVIIKPAGKGSAVVIWHQNNYLKQAKNQLNDPGTYLETEVIETNLVTEVTKCLRTFKEIA